jgi:hypothetical protein
MLLQDAYRQHYSKILEENIMLNKRIMSLTMAALMTASLAAPAFAAEETEKKEETSTAANTTTVTAKYEDVEIAVTVTKTASAIINPYGLPYDINDSTDASVGKVTGQQIVTQPMYISNDGTDVDLSVSASVTTTASGVTLSNKSTSSVKNNTAKQAFVYLEMESSNVTDVVAKTGLIDPDKVAAEYVDKDESIWQDYSASAENMLVLNTEAKASKDNMITLNKMVAATEAGKDDTYDKGSVALFRLAGDCVTSPTTAWATSDTFTATIAFTFAPVTE